VNPCSIRYPAREFRVASRRQLSRDVYIVTLKSADGRAVYLPPGHHVDVRATSQGHTVTRPYTPIVDFSNPKIISSGLCCCLDADSAMWGLSLVARSLVALVIHVNDELTLSSYCKF
jgi:hypothetical protein